jgi:hypothetical protein
LLVKRLEADLFTCVLCWSAANQNAYLGETIAAALANLEFLFERSVYQAVLGICGESSDILKDPSTGASSGKHSRTTAPRRLATILSTSVHPLFRRFEAGDAEHSVTACNVAKMNSSCCF